MSQVHAADQGLGLAARYRKVRDQSLALIENLSAEDCNLQSMPDVSPAKWHLAHTTWFFETFILRKQEGYVPFHPRFEYLFNSYYNSVGEQFPRPQRSLLSRPTLDEVRDYRAHVDTAMDAAAIGDPEIAALLELGLNHEQQHQELLLMDIKHALFCNPLYPAYSKNPYQPSDEGSPVRRIDHPGGLTEIGATPDRFCFDNETPKHRALIHDFSMADRCVSNAEYLEFMEDRGYQTPSLWLSDGWAMVTENQWQAPLYWVREGDRWLEYTLHGLVELDPNAPVTHVSLYEADAFASWSGARLPTETEWELLAKEGAWEGQFFAKDRLHPAMYSTFGGSVWQWTRSAYEPYPGFKAVPGAVGEYNGKFMCNQMVMRGGCCISPQGHVRPTYRNFFYPHMRWQFGGIRLAW